MVSNRENLCSKCFRKVNPATSKYNCGYRLCNECLKELCKVVRSWTEGEL